MAPAFCPPSIRKRLQGNELGFDGFEAAVVGGRRSIARAFGEEPCAQWRFSAPPGQLIYASHDRLSPNRARSLKLAIGRSVQVATGPVYNAVALVADFAKRDIQAHQNQPTVVTRNGETRVPYTQKAKWSRFGKNWKEHMGYTYNNQANKRIFEMTGDGLKTRTVLYLFAASHDFDGRALAASTTGAGLALLLKQYFGV